MKKLITIATLMALAITSVIPVSAVEISETQSNATVSHRGDVSLDNQISVVDSVIISKSVLGTYTMSTRQKNRADVNNDNKISIVDSILVMKQVVSGKQATHIHNYQPVYTQKLVKEAYDEDVYETVKEPVYKTELHEFCKGCGQDLSELARAEKMTVRGYIDDIHAPYDGFTDTRSGCGVCSTRGECVQVIAGYEEHQEKAYTIHHEAEYKKVLLYNKCDVCDDTI